MSSVVRVAAFLLLSVVAASVSAQATTPTPSNTHASTSGFVTVNGINLHYRDWGGTGDTILFLAGFNDSAHVFDKFAPRFTDGFHVLGLTRRGVGESDKPAGGYDTSTRVEDIRQFLDVLRVPKVSLIGHSMAGDEMTLFATRYPKRVAKLVYFDAAYDRTPEGWIAGLSDPANRPGMMQRIRMEALGLPAASEIPVAKMPAPDQRAIFIAMHKSIFAFRPDYTKVQAPAIAFYTCTANPHYPSPWLPKNADAGLRAKAEVWWQTKGHAMMRESVEQFRRDIPHGEIVELDDAKHYLFTGDTAHAVALKTREFLLR
jgi:non-heme chloroperoxidase